MLEHKSGNVSETRKDKGKVTMDGLYNSMLDLSDGTIILQPPSPRLDFLACTEIL